MSQENEFLIERSLSSKILMVGVYYKHNAPGGMATVIQYYQEYFEFLRYFPSWRLSRLPVKVFYGVSAFLNVSLALLLDRRVELLHIHAAADASFWRKALFVRLGKLWRKKVILHIHGSRFKDFYNESGKQERIRIILEMADCVIVLSESWNEWFIGIGINETRIKLLRNITRYPDLRKESIREDRKIRFLFLGEIGQRKGIFDLLRGIINNREILMNRIELRIGGNKNEEMLLQTIKTGGVDSFVNFEGWVSGEKKKNALNWADVYVLPSFNEGLPVGILEAMSYGCAIISTPVGGIPEVVKQNVNGTLVTPGNDDEIFSAIMKYVNDPAVISKEGAASIEIVEDYLPDKVLSNLKQIYNDLMPKQ